MTERQYQKRRLVSLHNYFSARPDELLHINVNERAILLNSLDNLELGLRSAAGIAARYLNQHFDDTDYKKLVQRMNKYNSELGLGS
mgnify:CR=1 FL=1